MAAAAARAQPKKKGNVKGKKVDLSMDPDYRINELLCAYYEKHTGKPAPRLNQARLTELYEEFLNTPEEKEILRAEEEERRKKNGGRAAGPDLDAAGPVRGHRAVAGPAGNNDNDNDNNDDDDEESGDASGSGESHGPNFDRRLAIAINGEVSDDGGSAAEKALMKVTAHVARAKKRLAKQKKARAEAPPSRLLRVDEVEALLKPIEAEFAAAVNIPFWRLVATVDWPWKSVEELDAAGQEARMARLGTNRAAFETACARIAAIPMSDATYAALPETTRLRLPLLGRDIFVSAVTDATARADMATEV